MEGRSHGLGRAAAGVVPGEIWSGREAVLPTDAAGALRALPGAVFICLRPALLRRGRAGGFGKAVFQSGAALPRVSGGLAPR